MNDIIAVSSDKWNEIAKSIPDDWEWTVDAWLNDRFGLEFVRFIRGHDISDMRHLYRIVNPALYTAFLLRYS